MEGPRNEAHYVIDPIKFRKSFALKIGQAATKTFYECITLHTFSQQQNSLNTRRKRIHWRLYETLSLSAVLKNDLHSVQIP